MICFSKLLFRIHGARVKILARSVLETPSDAKNWNLGRRVFSGSQSKTGGNHLTRFEIWISVNPWFLKKASTESGLLGVSKFMYLEADRAFSGGNPHEFMR